MVDNKIKSMKRIDGIICTVTGQVWKPGYNSVRKNMTADQYKDFQIFAAEYLRDEIIRAIDSQRYNSKWPALSINYLQWKKRHNLSLKMWEATGKMKSEIKVFKKGDYIAVGFKQKDVYPKTNVKINVIARHLEFGSRRKKNRPPSRPLFRPLMERLRKDVKVCHKKYVNSVKKCKSGFIYK